MAHDPTHRHQGAGIGGLAAAALLSRDVHEVTLFERFTTPRPLGSGLVVQPVGLAVLDQLVAGTIIPPIAGTRFPQA